MLISLLCLCSLKFTYIHVLRALVHACARTHNFVCTYANVCALMCVMLIPFMPMNVPCAISNIEFMLLIL